MENQTELTTENQTELTTENQTELTTENQTELTTENQTELITENPTETEIISEFLTELITENSTEKVTEIFTEIQTEIGTEKSTESLIEQPTEPINEKSIEKISETEIKNDNNECSFNENNDILNNNKCSTASLNDEQLNKLYNILKSNYLNSTYDGKNTIIKTENVAFQISTLEDQKNVDNSDISSIDLGDCEQELKTHYRIPNELSLIVFKMHIKSEDLIQTYVQYKIYNPVDLTPLNLTVCKNMKISVNAPINLDSSTSSLYDNLKDSGYDLFNENDPFYTDICSVYTSENDTDMTLDDRKQEIYRVAGNISLCQDGCELEYYNSTNKKANCECSPQINETELALSSSNDKFNMKTMADSFYTTLKNSNFLVLKCYKLAIDIKAIFENKGRIIMTIILILALIFLIIFCFTYNKKIDNNLTSIIISKNYQNLNNINNNNNINKKREYGKKKSKRKKKIKKAKTKLNKKTINENQSFPPKKKKRPINNGKKKK